MFSLTSFAREIFVKFWLFCKPKKYFNIFFIPYFTILLHIFGNITIINTILYNILYFKTFIFLESFKVFYLFSIKSCLARIFISSVFQVFFGLCQSLFTSKSTKFQPKLAINLFILIKGYQKCQFYDHFMHFFNQILDIIIYISIYINY